LYEIQIQGSRSNVLNRRGPRRRSPVCPGDGKPRAING